jgi:hypothetical protein
MLRQAGALVLVLGVVMLTTQKELYQAFEDDDSQSHQLSLISMRLFEVTTCDHMMFSAICLSLLEMQSF